jgi:triosephosphate isomerase
MPRKPFVAGNWKMHNTLADARELMKSIRDKFDPDTPVDVAVCPPFTLLYPMGKELDGTTIQLGAQNVHYESKGAFTGEISPEMLLHAGCQYVIIGHSERRYVFGETDELIAKKVAAAQNAGLSVIFCVGETLDEREAGRTTEVVTSQIEIAVHAGLDPDLLTIAYEPVWAIGTGKTATPDQAQEVHAVIRRQIAGIFKGDKDASAQNMRIQYGGSVKPGNAVDLMSCPDVDGALVGGACLAADDFVSIITGAAESAS